MLVEELRLRKGSLAAAGYLMLTEHHHLLYIWTDSGERCPVDSQVQWPGVPARLLVLQASSLLAGSHLGCQMSLEKKEFEKMKNTHCWNAYAYGPGICLCGV